LIPRSAVNRFAFGSAVRGSRVGYDL